MPKNYSAAELTRMQELGSTWIFRRALKDNVRYNKPEDIKKDKKYPELLKLYPAINDEWLNNYYKQQKRILLEFSNARFTEFTRDGGFMDFISKLVSSKFKISKKDSWNPADIWCIVNEPKVITDFKKAMNKKGMASIAELNALMRTMYKNRTLVGISLKLISGKEARFEEVNVGESVFPDVKNYNFNVSSMKCLLGLKGTNNNKTFQSQDTRVVVDALDEKGIIKYDFQIKPNTTSRLANLKFEPTASGAAKARIGKTPLDKLAILLKSYKVNYENSYRVYPQTLEEFDETKNMSYYEKIFNFIKRKGVDIGDVKDASQCIQNFRTVFEKESHIATSKLMQIDFLYKILSLKKETMDDLFTDMTFLAQKKGREFGPFGKLY